jgi:light-regulated signal transduction histidine kinase (bacteriophytochrome)
VPLEPLVEEVVADMRADLGDRKIELEIAPLPVAECDPDLIRQVFANLLSNAFKFTRPRESARIQVGHTELKGQPAVFVRDNGVGFDMKFADKLFGVFQRLHGRNDFEGTGIGLAIVQRIIQKHGGRVWAESRPEQGASFYFTLGPP